MVETAAGRAGEPTARGTRTAPDGTTLAWCRWEAAAPVGVVALLHGYGEHGGRYAHTAGWLNGLGWTVAALDQRGFGRSGGIRGDATRGFAPFVEDFSGFLAAERRPGRPLVVLAHSFGALVALGTLAEDPGRADAAILSSPSLVLRPLPWSLRLIQRVLLRAAPHLSLELPNNKDLVCSDPTLVAGYWTDPLCHRKLTAAYSMVFAEAFTLLLARAPALTTPLLVLEAGADTVADPDRADPFWRRVPPANLQRVRLAGFLHEVFHDARRAEAQDRAARWLADRFPAPAGNPGAPRAMRG